MTQEEDDRNFEKEMEVKGGNGGREARIAKLSLQFETVEILKPKNTAGKTKKELPPASGVGFLIILRVMISVWPLSLKPPAKNKISTDGCKK
ncbi:hypothetical protein FACS1894200_12870 [Spirochaetia bacterium]|nr:hypothetical protein FACS1894200_12870 [Spirochaetia bacterium]